MMPKRLKQRVKRALKKARHAYLCRFRAFAPADLARTLAALGIAKGDTVLVHSSFNSFEGFSGGALDAIRVLQDAIGPGGTLAMPTLSFTGTAIGWAEKRRVFDVGRTPSQTGLLTELFRRSPDVVRSVHPTHSVAAWGAGAKALIAEHFRAATPCGIGSPYSRLAQTNGKILLLGTGIGVLTYFHTVEEELEPVMPFTPFTRDTYAMISKDNSGNAVETRSRLFDPAVSRRRNLAKLVPELKRRGAWRESRVGNLDVILLTAAEVSSACRAMADRGEYCYDDVG